MNLENRDIYFEIDSQMHKLPVLPQDITLQLQSGTVISETVKLGEISILRDRKLKTFSIASFFPRFGDRSFIRTLNDFKEPEHYIDLFTKVLESKSPMNFVLTGFKAKPFYVSIDAFEYAYTAQDEDINYTLTLREYRHYGKEGKQLDKQEPLFEGDETKAYESLTSTRPKNGFAIGDRVVVNGKYFRDPWGAAPFARLPINLMTSSPKGQIGNVRDILKGARNNALSNSECVIVSIELDINSNISHNFALYKYQIADAATKRALGWVKAESMRHKL
ncbi:MAG: hypothetical protein M0Q90_16410 [Bacteroidales bacterium]|jgi:hypothetical protein|nr:hypothetical protein [Bacteroidales bacterium]